MTCKFVKYSIFFEREKTGRERREYKVRQVGKEGGSGKSWGMNMIVV